MERKTRTYSLPPDLEGAPSRQQVSPACPQISSNPFSVLRLLVNPRTGHCFRISGHRATGSASAGPRRLLFASVNNRQSSDTCAGSVSLQPNGQARSF
ncbi:hypothetical protein EVAR_60018_1 [Eumeta japonica]|uniref:Uncharacterized protein n=1 Tax=Eumeta variegata TaxID=151549 RepID=A0A4C1ZLD3_EUMVA|nr:hypothetical protein EVAR_60018_1 [Eumeta japonica]